eukprot:UN26017
MYVKHTFLLVDIFVFDTFYKKSAITARIIFCYTFFQRIGLINKMYFFIHFAWIMRE